MLSVYTDRVLSIMPAGDWLAVYARDGKPEAQPLVGWALIENAEDEEAGNRSIHGLELDGDGVDLASSNGNFLGYAHQSELDKIHEWYGDMARAHAERTKATP